MAYRYLRGDYMRGYRGDPGIFGFLGKAIKGAAGIVSRAGIPIVSGIAGTVAGAISSRTSPRGTITLPGGGPRMQLGPMQVTRVPGIRGAAQRLIPGGATGYQVDPATGIVRRKYRRMNVTNPKALRRAIRRQAGFVKLARRALKGSGYKIVSSGSRRPKTVIKESGPGSVSVQ